MNSFIKSQKMMKEVFFGYEKSPNYQKILSKGFEIFCHALYFPNDANYCYECPQPLGKDDTEDNYQDVIKYSIVDGIQMGCRTNDKKSSIKHDYFVEVVSDTTEVKGVEAKDRTFLKSKNVRKIIGSLVSDYEKPNALRDALKLLNELDLDEKARSILEMLHRLASQRRVVPQGYLLFLNELSLETPVSALLPAYSSNRSLYEKMMKYLSQKLDIFSSFEHLEDIVNNFPVLSECIQQILECEQEKHKHFLPDDVASILKSLIKFRFEFDKLSKKVAAPRQRPDENFMEPVADFFPSYPIHGSCTLLYLFVCLQNCLQFLKMRFCDYIRS